ncbi:hypothetical protein MTO96_024158 [Rhipicephalus appendiculatus]
MAPPVVEGQWENPSRSRNIVLFCLADAANKGRVQAARLLDVTYLAGADAGDVDRERVSFDAPGGPCSRSRNGAVRRALNGSPIMYRDRAWSGATLARRHAADLVKDKDGDT